MTDVFQTIIAGITSGGLYALPALGIVLIIKATHVFNFAQGSFVVIGAFLMNTLLIELSLPFYLSLILLLVSGLVVGFLTFRLVMRPLIGQPVISSIIATLALFAFVEGAVILIWTAVPRSLISGRGLGFLAETLSIGSIKVSWLSVFIVLFAIVIIAAFMYLFLRTKLGLGMRASCEDPQVARSVGINVNLTFALVWSIAGLLGLATGVLSGLHMSVTIGLSALGIKAFAAVMVGGIESVGGTIVGAMIIGLAEAFVIRYGVGFLSTGFSEIVPFVIVLLILMIRPYGLFGQKRIERV